MPKVHGCLSGRAELWALAVGLQHSHHYLLHNPLHTPRHLILVPAQVHTALHITKLICAGAKSQLQCLWLSCTLPLKVQLSLLLSEPLFRWWGTEKVLESTSESTDPSLPHPGVINHDTDQELWHWCPSSPTKTEGWCTAWMRQKVSESQRIPWLQNK